MLSRREFLEAGSLAAAFASTASGARLRSIGVQLYTVRSLFPDKAPETLKAIEAIGYREVEATFANLDRVVPAIEAAKLKGVSVHLDSATVTKGSAEDIARTMDDLKKKGF